MKVTPLGCTVFGIFGQVTSNLASFAFFSTWVYWITNGYMANIQRSQIHLGLSISAMVFIVYSLLMSCHICYVIHHDFDNIRAYFWTRIHLFILVVAFSFLSLVELSMYLEISNTQLNLILKEIAEEGSMDSSAFHFPDWMEKWQITNACCGIVSYKDYTEYGDRKSVSSNCCRWKNDFVDEDGWKCGDGVLRMNYAFMEEKIYTKGCGADMKESLKHLSLYGCILASISTVFVVISSMFYLTFLQQYSQEQHMTRMKRYDNEEREQLKLLSKKRQQQHLSRNSSKGPVKAHGTKVPSTNSQQSRSRSRSSSRSHKKSHISADMENVEYNCEEKCYIKNIDKKSHHNKGSLKSKSCPQDLDKQNSRLNTTMKNEKREALLSTRSLPKQKRSKSRTASVRSNNEGEYQRDYQDYRENLDFPSFKSNENLFLNLIDAASSRRMSKNVSNTSSTDFQEDILVPRVLTRKSKQVLFDQNSNVYYDREHDLSDDVSVEFEEDCQTNSSENTTLDIKFTEDDDDDCDPGDVIVRQL